MNCPKCGHEHVVPVTQTQDKLYCPKCKHAWDKKGNNKEGSLQFDGIPHAKQFIDLILQNQEISPPNKAGLVAQLTAGFFDQWFEGFKAGLMADLVYRLDLMKQENKNGNGENSAGAERATGEYRAGDPYIGVSNDENSGPDGSLRKAIGSTGRVKEIVAGIEFIRPANLQVSDKIYELVAEIKQNLDTGLNPPTITSIEYSGSTVSVTLKP